MKKGTKSAIVTIAAMCAVIVGFIFIGTALLHAGPDWPKIGRESVAKTAAFDHNCPISNIKVTAEDTQIWAYTLEVCGQSRKYRDFGGGRAFHFIDVTDNLCPRLPESSGDEIHLMP